MKGRQTARGSRSATAPTSRGGAEKTGREGGPDRCGRVVQTWVLRGTSAR